MKHPLGRFTRDQSVKDTVLLKSRRRCCLCFGLDGDTARKKGQLAHIDHDPANSVESNLVFLCLDHHDEYDSKTSQSKKITRNEIKKYKLRLETSIAKNEIGLDGSGCSEPLKWASIEIAEESSWFDIELYNSEDFSLHSYSWTGTNGEGELPQGKHCDPIFDITVINTAPYPTVLSRIGVIAKCAWSKFHGFPSPEPIGVSEHITIPFKWKVGNPQWAVLPDPVYLSPGSPYRYKLRLGQFAKAVPGSDAIISLACMVDQKVFESDNICLGV